MSKKVVIVIVILILITTIIVFLNIARNRVLHWDQPQMTDNAQKKSISIKKQGEYNYVIFTDENGSEFILDKAPWNRDNWENEGRNVTEYVIYSDARFSPNENYVLYKLDVWEGGLTNVVYDLDKKERVQGFFGSTVGFTPDEKYFFACDRGYNFSTAKIYELPSFNVIYDLFGSIVGEGDAEFYNAYLAETCEFVDYENDLVNRKNKIRFYLENESDPRDSKEIYFDLNTQKAIQEK